MSGPDRTTVREIYRTDLERHLYAPSPRAARRRARRRDQDPLASRMLDWLIAGWARWKALAQMTYS